MATYKDYPSISINEINQSFYTPATVEQDLNIGIVGFASWGEIGVPILITTGNRTNKIGNITKEYPLPYIATDKVLETGKANVLYWRLPGGNNMAKASGDLVLIEGISPAPDFKLTFTAKYYGSYGNNIGVKIIQIKDVVGSTTYYSYDLQILVNGNIVKTYKNVEFFDNTKTNYYLNLLENNEYVSIIESGKSDYDIDDLNVSGVFTEKGYINVSLENGDDDIPDITTEEATIKTYFEDNITGIPAFKNKSYGLVRIMLNTYHKYDKDIIGIYLQLANTRKDFLFLTSTEKNVSDLDTINTASADLPSSSYGAVYTNWEKIFYSELNQYIWIPSIFNVIKTYLSLPYLWNAPAGYDYGFYQGNGYLDYFLNEEEAIPKLQSGKNIVNPIIKDNTGFYIMGQKTMLRENNALNRINTRMALLDLETNLLTIMKKYLFTTVNDAETRTNFLKEVTPLVNKYINTKAFTSIDIICDETNNTSDVINDNAFVVDIHLTPTKTNEKIGINIFLHEYGWTIEETVSK